MEKSKFEKACEILEIPVEEAINVFSIDDLDYMIYLDNLREQGQYWQSDC